MAKRGTVTTQIVKDILEAKREAALAEITDFMENPSAERHKVLRDELRKRLLGSEPTKGDTDGGESKEGA